MTRRSRLNFGLLTVLLVLALAPSTFAQINIQVIPVPSTGEINVNRTAQTAEAGSAGAGVLISGQIVANSPLTTTQLRLTFPAPITAAPKTPTGGGPSDSFGTAAGIPSQDFIRIEGQTGLFASITQAFLTTSNNRITVLLPGFGTSAPNLDGSFRVVGVRIDANGLAGAQNVTAALDSGANNYLLLTSSAQIISNVSAGATFGIGARSGETNLGTATIFTNRNIVDPTASIIAVEGFASAFRTAAQLSASSSPTDNSIQLKLTFNNVPTGVTLTLANINQTGSTALTQALSNTNITTTNNTTTLSFTATSLSSSQTAMITATATLSTTATLSAGTITATAEFSPVGDQYDTTGSIFVPTQTGGYPRFASSVLGPVTVVNIVPASTSMLIPYAIKLGAYDTGIAIANTTADPFGAAGGGATAASGSVTMNFYPTAASGGAGTGFSLTTSSTVLPGGVASGLSSDGTIAAGATWRVLMSQLLTAAGQTGDFAGYVFISANFLNAHGTATISDFRTYSLTANVLILPPPATSSRNAPGGGAEGLAF